MKRKICNSSSVGITPQIRASRKEGYAMCIPYLNGLFGQWKLISALDENCEGHFEKLRHL